MMTRTNVLDVDEVAPLVAVADAFPMRLEHCTFFQT